MCYRAPRGLLFFCLLLTYGRVALAKEQPQTFFSVTFPKVCVSNDDVTFSVTLPPLDGSRPWGIVLLKIEDKYTHEIYTNMTIDVHATEGSINVTVTHYKNIFC